MLTFVEITYFTAPGDGSIVIDFKRFCKPKKKFVSLTLD